MSKLQEYSIAHIPRLDKFEIPNFQITLWIKASIFKVLYLATRLD